MVDHHPLNRRASLEPTRHEDGRLKAQLVEAAELLRRCADELGSSTIRAFLRRIAVTPPQAGRCGGAGTTTLHPPEESESFPTLVAAVEEEYAGKEFPSVLASSAADVETGAVSRRYHDKLQHSLEARIAELEADSSDWTKGQVRKHRSLAHELQTRITRAVAELEFWQRAFDAEGVARAIAILKGETTT